MELSITFDNVQVTEMMWITLHIWLVNVITFVATFLTSEIKQFLSIHIEKSYN